MIKNKETEEIKIMKSTVIKIHPRDIKPRDYFHFGLKLKTRMHIHTSKKTYQRHQVKSDVNRNQTNIQKGENQ
jgi:predicted nucleic acid-binding protein